MAKDGVIELEVVTPTGMALKEQVDEVIAPSVQGQFGVLPGHLPLMAAMATGLVGWCPAYTLFGFKTCATSE